MPGGGEGSCDRSRRPIPDDKDRLPGQEDQRSHLPIVVRPGSKALGEGVESTPLRRTRTGAHGGETTLKPWCRWSRIVAKGLLRRYELAPQQPYEGVERAACGIVRHGAVGDGEYLAERSASGAAPRELGRAA